MSDVSVYNTHPDFRPDFRRRKCVLYAENYGKSYKYFLALLVKAGPKATVFCKNLVTTFFIVSRKSIKTSNPL